ncbi:MAG: hypothetical protein ACYC27_05710 [Armatimonadota bacterium]
MIKQAINVILVAVMASIAALCWFFIVMVGTGDSNPVTYVILYLAGIIPAAIAGLMVGFLRDRRLTTASIIIGWLLSLWLTPATLVLFNPVNSRSSLIEKGITIVALILFAASGILFTLLGMRYVKKKSVDL